MAAIERQKIFIGRKYEQTLLEEDANRNRASLITIYGRRRVGKTRLVTEFYKDKHLWKFDGVENEGKIIQIKNILDRLSTYTGDNIYKSLKCDTWLGLLKILDRAMTSDPHKHKRAVFLDEFPYMCSRRTELVSAIKWAWDNLWQDKDGFFLILCGSVASFMIKKVVKSSALYGRIKIEICLKPLPIPDVFEFFGGKKSIREICDLYMFSGGIPEYLLQINPKESVAQNIAQTAFCRDGYFTHEFDRIFKDIFGEEKTYKDIILTLCKYKNLKVPELAGLLGKATGGGFVEYLENLESAGFIKSVTPFDKPRETKLKRYSMDDEYLLFYFKFIYPNLKRIETNTDISLGLKMLKSNQYKSWAGFAFERLCLKHANEIMRHLKIDQLVKNYGPYFDRASNTKEGVQIDLMFDRHDHVITICELKYHDSLIGKWVMEEVEKKIAMFGNTKKTIEKILITTNGATKDLADTNFFSRVVLIDEIFNAG